KQNYGAICTTYLYSAPKYRFIFNIDYGINFNRILLNSYFNTILHLNIFTENIKRKAIYMQPKLSDFLLDLHQSLAETPKLFY
ncbi:MAG: hypothetical protein KAT52_01760, partial [Desulfobacterales bacterium]|nr:hypothetical protein [Desulfobacterales bacterium]